MSHQVATCAFGSNFWMFFFSKCECVNGHATGTDWSEVPTIFPRPIFQGYFSGDIPWYTPILYGLLLVLTYLHFIGSFFIPIECVSCSFPGLLEAVRSDLFESEEKWLRGALLDGSWWGVAHVRAYELQWTTLFLAYIYYIYVCFLAEWTFINPRYCCCEQQSGFPWFPYESARYSFPGRLVWKPRYKRLSLKITGWWFKTLFYLSISYGNVILPVENHILWKPLIYWYMETIYWNLPLVVFILFKMVIAPPTRYNWHK